MREAAEITRRAKSNLAFALAVLPEERRRDAVTFYAYCRTLDDLADAPGIAMEVRRECLNQWRDGLMRGFASPDELQKEVVAMRDRHNMPSEWLVAVADGCLEDLEPKRYATWKDLDGYVWKVACAVGLVSARIFGCKDPAADAYAESLGRALQLTNILRDIGEDWANGRRLYVPLEEMESVGISEDDFDRHRECGKFAVLMERMADRADHYYREAARGMPGLDRKALLPARIMAAIYQDLLGRMRADGFDVFRRRYRVPTWRKLWILTKLRIFG